MLNSFSIIGTLSSFTYFFQKKYIYKQRFPCRYIYNESLQICGKKVRDERRMGEEIQMRHSRFFSFR